MNCQKHTLAFFFKTRAWLQQKGSGIATDANLWAHPKPRETYKYPLERLLRVITVSLETMKLVSELPGLDIC